ncbi:Uncharacterised protein [Mycoplasmopsis edwardii]|uniref:Uncharacterized protein n=1 Tax=Mycoplasmopsis edwardii TaxID=53558 RepID=A0A3B0PRT5_9BACT|nr:Uncharacterised protein [Mycoplasmopsis edwardii]
MEASSCNLGYLFAYKLYFLFFSNAYFKFSSFKEILDEILSISVLGMFKNLPTSRIEFLAAKVWNVEIKATLSSPYLLAK